MKNDQHGYGALEMLISLLITSLLMAALYTVLFQSQATSESQQDSMALRKEQVDFYLRTQVRLRNVEGR